MCKNEEQGDCRKGHGVKPGHCSHERIRECHGDQSCHPCETNPLDCSPERTGKCHGPEEGHACEQG